MNRMMEGKGIERIQEATERGREQPRRMTTFFSFPNSVDSMLNGRFCLITWSKGLQKRVSGETSQTDEAASGEVASFAGFRG